MTSTEESWAERVRAWRASGLSAERFAAGKGYAGSTLRYRANKMAKAKPQTAPAQALTLRRLVRAPRTADGAQLVVQVGRASFVVGRGFDAELVRALVSCLAEGTS